MRTSLVARTAVGRLIAVVAYAALLLATGAQAAGVHRCPVHHGPASAAASAHQAGGHASHGGAADHDTVPSHEQAPHCCCIDPGCCSASLASVSTGVVASAPLPERSRTIPAGGARLFAPLAAPYLAPLSTGPPPAAIA